MGNGTSGDRFSGRVALVTGGASGIGDAVARRLVAEGAAVASLDLEPRAAEGILAVGGDVSRSSDVEAAVNRGAKVMMIDADPGAADFYRRMGAVDDGVIASTVIPGRFLPRLKLELR